MEELTKKIRKIRWTDNSKNFSEKLAIPQANRFDDLYRNYFKDLALFAGVFATIAGTFLLKEDLGEYLIIRFSIILSMIGFLLDTILAVFFIASNVIELLPSITYTSKIGFIFSELSYLETERKRGSLSDKEYASKEEGLIQKLHEARIRDRSSEEKIKDAEKLARTMRWSIRGTFFVFMVSVILLAAGLMIVFLGGNLAGY